MVDVSIERLERAHRAVAKLVLKKPIFSPIFDRLDQELLAARNTPAELAMARAREVLGVTST